MDVTDLFKALGDPIRIEMVRRVSTGEPQTISTVSDGLEVTRQGARKHLQILADTKVITLESKGRNTFVHFNRHTLDRAKAFITELEHRWDKRLEALRDFVEKNN